ncbi:lysosomal proton-coupled steroid conjugate and bile acid symporter SLC46A3-like [Tubulanus polymorphus]|uniref:lysosomal proton-coupled steroid conjugate and bile acid symporter SLC46A3-like n=1 Tax=Tubulanus polymorphus TaxID=672921 RepID=UPI003DA6686B
MECIKSGAIVAEMVFLMYKSAESLLEPTVKLFIYQEVCLIEYQDHGLCYSLRKHPIEEAHVQKLSANYIMYYKILLNFPAIILGLFCGAWSDRVGRKLPMILPCIGAIIACLFYMFGMLPQSSALAFVLIGAAINGCFGKSAILSMAVYSYVSDVSSKENRTKKLSKLLAMNFFGLFLGSLLAGSLLDRLSFNFIFLIVVGILAACIVVLLMFLKESVPGIESNDIYPEIEPTKKNGKPFLFNPVNIRDSVEVLIKPRQGNLRFHLVLVFFVVITNQICKAGEIDVTLLFVEYYPLSWSKSLYGYLLAVDYATLGLSLCLLLPLLSVVFKIQDVNLVIIGIVFKTTRLVFVSVSDQTWMIFVGVIVGSVSGMIVSGSKSIISKLVDEDEIGKIFSLLSCGETASNLLGAIIFTNLYSVTFQIFPGMAFVIEAAIYIVCLGGIIWIACDGSVTERIKLFEKAGGSLKNEYGTCSQNDGTPSTLQEIENEIQVQETCVKKESN